MSVKMLDAFNDPAAFFHTGTGPQRNRESFLSSADGRMRLVSVAPWRAAVDEGFELPGNIRPVGRRYGNNKKYQKFDKRISGQPQLIIFDTVNSYSLKLT